MKRYKCHKVVEAAKIVGAEPLQETGATVLTFEDGSAHTVAPAWVLKHLPEPGGYFVRYEDGYTSFSPGAAFEAGYAEENNATGLTFGEAIAALKAGKRVARGGWNGRGMWLVLVPGTSGAALRAGTPYREATGLDSCDILPHIDMWTVNAHGRRAMLPGWLASQTDMLSDDWCVVE